LSRGENIAALFALAEFCRNIISLTHLLNKKYMPFSKWAHRSLYSLPVLGTSMAGAMLVLADKPEGAAKTEHIELICATIIEELRRQELSDSRDDFLLGQAQAVQRGILDAELRNLHILAE
jgi:hypothetical protein